MTRMQEPLPKLTIEEARLLADSSFGNGHAIHSYRGGELFGPRETVVKAALHLERRGFVTIDGPRPSWLGEDRTVVTVKATPLGRWRILGGTHPESEKVCAEERRERAQYEKLRAKYELKQVNHG